MPAYTGGSAAIPRSISIYDRGDQWANFRCVFYNPQNDFRGDLILDKTNAGTAMTVSIGDSSHPYADSILGDAANDVRLSKYTVLQVGAGVESVSWHRGVTGAGTLKSLVPLALTSDAVLTADSTAFPLTVSVAGALSDSPGTAYAVTVDADDTDVSTKIAFSPSAALALLGTFEVEADDPSVRITAGTRWAVGSVSASAGALVRTSFAHSPGWHVYAEGDAADGWTIYAEKVAPGLTVTVR